MNGGENRSQPSKLKSQGDRGKEKNGPRKNIILRSKTTTEEPPTDAKSTFQS